MNIRFVLLFKKIAELTILLISCLYEINELFIILAKEQGHLLLNFATADIVKKMDFMIIFFPVIAGSWRKSDLRYFSFLDAGKE